MILWTHPARTSVSVSFEQLLLNFALGLNFDGSVRLQERHPLEINTAGASTKAIAAIAVIYRQESLRPTVCESLTSLNHPEDFGVNCACSDDSWDESICMLRYFMPQAEVCNAKCENWPCVP